MSLRAKDRFGKLTYIEDAIKGDPYFCQVCGQPMMQKRCIDRADHFAHYSPHGNPNIVPCSDHWGYDKTEWHMEWQKRFPIDNIERVLEFNGKKHIADLLIGNFVIEFQHSSISIEEFTERNNFYTSLGYKVIWLFDLIEEYNDGRFAQTDFDFYYKWAYAKKLFRQIEFENVKATIYFQLSDDDDPDVGVIERVKDIRELAATIKTDSNQCFSIKEFVELVSSNSQELFEKPKPAPAPFSIDNCKSITELWDESYSAMIVKNKHTNSIIRVFGRDGRLVRDYKTGKIRCKYCYEDFITGYYVDKGDYYNVFDEDKKIWVLMHSFHDKNYEQRIALENKQKEEAKKERETALKLVTSLRAAETEACQTLYQLTKTNYGPYLYVDNVFNGKKYFVKIVNSYLSFNIYELDPNDSSVVNPNSLNHELYNMYSYRIWKKADI